jgi:hypothetical protein
MMKYSTPLKKHKLSSNNGGDITTQCIGLPLTGTRNHNPIAAKASHAQTFKLDQSMGADQFNSGYLFHLRSLNSIFEPGEKWGITIPSLIQSKPGGIILAFLQQGIDAIAFGLK